MEGSVADPNVRVWFLECGVYMRQRDGIARINDWNKKVVDREDTYNDAGQTINGDVPLPSSNCEKAVVW